MNFGLDKLVKPLLAGGYKEETSIAIGRNEGGRADGKTQPVSSWYQKSQVKICIQIKKKKEKRKALTGFLFSLSGILRPLERVSTSM